MKEILCPIHGMSCEPNCSARYHERPEGGCCLSDCGKKINLMSFVDDESKFIIYMAMKLDGVTVERRNEHITINLGEIGGGRCAKMAQQIHDLLVGKDFTYTRCQIILSIIQKILLQERGAKAL
jgi:hypothetical protein